MAATEPLRLVDTSVLIRYLTNDIPERAVLARRLIDSDAPIGVTTVVLLETAFVLRNPPYAQKREDVVDVLVELLQRENVQGVGVEKSEAALALMLCRPSGTVGSGDALIAATGRTAGITEAYSFDETFARAGLRVVAIPPSDADDGGERRT
jgi:predicted nucleic acid-binding protein